MSLPLYIRLDGAVVATQPDDTHDWVTIEEAARIVREHNERAAQLEQNPGPSLEELRARLERLQASVDRLKPFRSEALAVPHAKGSSRKGQKAVLVSTPPRRAH